MTDHQDGWLGPQGNPSFHTPGMPGSRFVSTQRRALPTGAEVFYIQQKLVFHNGDFYVTDKCEVMPETDCGCFAKVDAIHSCDLCSRVVCTRHIFQCLGGCGRSVCSRCVKVTEADQILVRCKDCRQTRFQKLWRSIMGD